MRKFNPEFKLVDVKLMERHPRVQRNMREWHVRNIMKTYNPLYVNPLTVAYTTTGANRRYWIIDGGHTHEAASRMGAKALWCKVIKVHSYAEISEIITDMNKNKLVMSPEDAHVIESDFQPDSDSARIDAILRGAGLDRSDFRAFATLHHAYKKLGDDGFMVLAELLACVRIGGGRMDVETIRALAILCKRYSYSDLQAARIDDVLKCDFVQLKAMAADSLRNARLANNPHVLVHAIEDAAFLDAAVAA